MRRTIAGTAAVLLTSLVIGGPLASSGGAAPSTLQCGGGSPPGACATLDALAAQLAPIVTLLGPDLAPLAEQAQGLAARSDGAGGVPTLEVIDVSQALLAQLGTLPAPVQTLVGAARLGEVTNTLHALVRGLTAPAASGEQASSGGSATPAKTSKTSAPAPLSGARASEASPAAAPAAKGGAASADKVPAVPVGDPLALAPLALPEFGFDPSFAPVAAAEVKAAPTAEEAQLAAVEGSLGGDSRAELVVVAGLSVLLLAAAGIAQLQAKRHQIPA